MSSGDAFMAKFADMLGDTITVTPGNEDGFGDFITSGDVLSIPCRLSTSAKLVRDLSGRETVSSVRAILDNFYDLDIDNHRFTISSLHDPYSMIKAIGIKKVSDESGPLYEVVILP